MLGIGLNYIEFVEEFIGTKFMMTQGIIIGSR